MRPRRRLARSGRDGGVTLGFRGAIFDVDGVLVASPYERAWREGEQLSIRDAVELAASVLTT